MVVTSIGINKNQKKFQPKIKPKIDKKIIKESIKVIDKPTENNFEKDNSNIILAEKKFKETVVDEKILEKDALNLKEVSKVTSSQAETQLIKPSEILDKPTPKDLFKPVQKSISKEDEVFLKPSQSTTKKIIEKNSKGTLISAPTSSRKTAIEESFAEDSEQIDPNQPFDLMASLVFGKEKAQKRQRVTRSSKKKLTDISDVSIQQISAPGKTQPQDDQSEKVDFTLTVSEFATSLDFTDGNLFKIEPKDASDDDEYKEPEPPNKVFKHKTAKKTQKTITKAINNYKGTAPLELSNIPLDALCAPVISYGEKMPETKRTYRKGKKKLEAELIEEEDGKFFSVSRRSETAGPRNAHKIAAPRVKIVDGKIIIDDDSLQIQHHTLDQNDHGGPLERVELGMVGDAGNYLNCFTYVNKEKPKKWSEEETDLFFQGLISWGTDFEMVAKGIPGRTRRQIKLKFTREERENPVKITEALTYRRYIPLSVANTPLPINTEE